MMLCYLLVETMKIPIILVCSFLVLFNILGLSFLSGIGIFILAFIVNAYLGAKAEKINKEIMKCKDRRMNVTTQAISNVKQLKFYSWTQKFLDDIREKRKAEVYQFKKSAILITFVIVSLYFFPAVPSSVVFSTFIGTGHYINLA